MQTGTIILLVVLAVFIPAAIGFYNVLIRRKNEVNNVFGSVDAMLKKRYDLIPNLISAVQRYMQHEAELLTSITKMRAKAISGDLSDDEKVEINNRISQALGGILVAVENYPDLKANQNFLHLQASLNEVEEQISASRRAYNAAVTAYNNAVEMFPGNILALVLGYRPKPVLKTPEAERPNISVKKLFSS